VVGDWRRLHNEELHNLYPSPNVIWMIKSRRVGCVETCNKHGTENIANQILVAKLEGTPHVKT
jgi:hypothetical protein